jgi:hypothetical protein
MDFRWWDEAHETLWRVASHAELLETRSKARQTARETVTPLLAVLRSDCAWTNEKAQILHALDAQGITGILASAHDGLTLPLALTIWELASVDAGVATCSLSGSLAQMPIRDFGTDAQRKRYLGRTDLRHGALCLTEPLPGAGADAMSLTGRMTLAGAADGEALLEIHKRGRFTSHMDFAEFVVAAVEGRDGVRGSGLVILEPDDAGDFERGAPVRKLGHRFASTTNPIFRLRVPASRLVGGYTMEHETLIPCFSHRTLLEPALRRMRALLGLMTAAKALATVQDWFDSPGRKSDGAELRLAMAELWATGEAAASLGFCAARLNDEQDAATNRTADARLAALFSSAAKLFSSSHVAESLRQAAAWNECDALTMFASPDFLIDAQIEDMYMGPSALQRRMVSAAMIDARFLAEFQAWTAALDKLAKRLPRAGMRTLAAGMRLWQWTLERLREHADARGAKQFCDARQGVTFAMADALCGLLAARSLALDVLEMERRSPGKDGTVIFRDLSLLAAGHAASRASQICVELLCGYAERFPVSDAEQKTLGELRTDLCISLRGMMDARERIAEFLRCAQDVAKI